MNDFSQAAISFTDDDNPAAGPRPALLHAEDVDVNAARDLLDSLDAQDWPAYAIDGHTGVWVTPKGGIAVIEFADVLAGLGDGWTLRADPRN